MLAIRHWTDRGLTGIPPERLEQALAESGYVWIDISDPDPTDEDLVRHPALGLHPLAVEDILEDHHLPKVDVYADHLLLTVHPLRLEASTVEVRTSELDIALGERFLLTWHHPPMRAIDRVAEALETDAGDLDRPVVVLHRILDEMAAVYGPFLDLLSARLDLVESDVLDSPSSETRAEIFALRRDLITLRRISVPQADTIARLATLETPLFGPDDKDLFGDVHDHVFRMSELAEVYRQLAESAYDMYRSVREDETNRRLTVLTMISTVLLPITAVAGIYGMNFVHMPELDQPWAYPAVLGLFGAFMVGGLLLFRSWGWLGRREDEEMRRRRRLVERIELPGLDTVLKVPAYGARFAVSTVLRAGRRTRRRDAREEIGEG